MSYVELLKELVAAGPSVVYLAFLVTVYAQCRKDARESKERYEALLERTITALTSVADLLEKEQREAKRREG